MTTYIWPEGGAGGRFAPKYLVGNVPAGDSNVASSVDGFVYIPDPGDGTGIALALTQPDGPGDVYIRPGEYERTAGVLGSVEPLVIPVGVRVMGAGFSTLIRLRNVPLDGGVFVLDGINAELHDVHIMIAPDMGGTATAAILVNADSATVENVGVYLSNTNVPEAICVGSANATNTRVAGCYFESASIGMRILANRCRILGNSVRVAVVGAISGIVLEASATRCVVEGNVVNSQDTSASAITNAANLCAITGNEVEVTNPVAGITLTGDNNVVVSNVSGATTPVNDLGVGNEVAHNI